MKPDIHYLLVPALGPFSVNFPSMSPDAASVAVQETLQKCCSDQISVGLTFPKHELQDHVGAESYFTAFFRNHQTSSKPSTKHAIFDSDQ
jgi:hypothetical protein